MRIALAFVCAASAVLAQQKPGYTDTPRLPSGWRVHDAERPHPPIVDPGPAPAAPTPVPPGAIVLFDGTGLDAWQGRDGAAKWAVRDGYMEVTRSGDIRTRQEFGDCRLHVEWATPAEVKGSSQGRGNSGVILFGNHEVQVLDSYDNLSYADGQAAALYGQHPPLVNACRKPGEWQTYDIVFRAPRFTAAGELESPARVTVIHNGIVVHNNQTYLGPTVHRALPKYGRARTKGPVRLQDHGNPVRYRNIWIRPL